MQGRAGLLTMLEPVLKNSVYKLLGITFSGWGLKLLWGIEALVLIGACTYKSLLQVHQLYCESCRNWLKADYRSPDLELPKDRDVTALMRQALNDDFSALESLARRKGGERWCNLQLASCSCGSLHVLSKEQSQAVKQGGKDKTISIKHEQHAVLTPDRYDRLRAPGQAKTSNS